MKILALYDRVAPRPADAATATIAAAVSLVPLCGLRLWVAVQLAPKARTLDYWRMLTAEIESWCIFAAVAALLLRLAGGRPWRAMRVGVHGFATFVLLCSVVELVFASVMGSRGDWDLIGFALGELAEVLPVAASEIRPAHLAGLAGALVLGFAPLALPVARLRSPWWGRLFPLVLAPVIALEVGGRPAPKSDLKTMQPGFVELMFWDGLDRLRNPVVVPAPGSTDALVLDWAIGGRRPNIVLVLLESTGAAATTLHDPSLDTTPNLARLAKEGLVVDTAYSVVPHTSKSIVTTMCGTWPHLVSAIRESEPGGLPGRCLPDILKEAGYRTAFFQTAFQAYERRVDLVHALGFDLFRSRETLARPPFAVVNYFGLEDKAMLEPGLAWSTQEPGRPFFATWLTLTSHHDYGTPPEWPKVDFPDAKGRREQYYNAVRYVDSFLGELLDGYRAAGLADDTLFVIMGDHGEAFNEHGRSYHDLVIWDEGLHIPMVLLGFDRAGTITGPRQQIDVVPTLLDVLGATVRRGALPGTSLLRDVEPERTLHHSCWRSHRCLAMRRGDDKFIEHYRERSPQRFDLGKDPGETAPVSTADAELESLGRDARLWRAAVNGRYEALYAMFLERIQRPDTETRAVATWGGKVELLGCGAEHGGAVPGEEAWIRCRWRAKEPIAMAWRLRTSLRGRFETVEDIVHPVDGQLPTFRWRAGWVVEDSFRVAVPKKARPGQAVLWLGWQRFAGGDVALDDAGDALLFQAATFQVLEGLVPP